MSLRRTTIITVFITFLLLVIVLTVSLQTVFSQHFRFEESQQNILNMQRVQAAFENNYILLNYLADEWANLPEMKTFITEGNDEIVQEHLQKGNLESLEIDSVFVINQAGEIILGGQFDFDNGKFIEFTSEIVDELKASFPMQDSVTTAQNQQGVVIVDQTPFLMVGKTIFVNKESNTVIGQILLGQRFDDAKIQALTRQVKFPIEMGLVSDPNLSGDISLARNYFLNNNETTYLLPVSEFHIAGFILINDINQQPALILRAEQYRYVARNADVVLRYMLLALIISATVFAAIIFGGMEQTVLSRLSRLSREVKEITSNPLEQLRVTIDKKDEISSVGENINQMLDALETAQQEKNALQQQLFGIVESIEDIIFTINKDLSKVQFFGSRAQQLSLETIELGSNDNLPDFLKASWSIHLDAAKKVLAGEHLIYETPVSVMEEDVTVQISMSPIFEKDGTIIGIVGVGRDISQTKKMEESLEKRYEELQAFLEISQLFLQQKSVTEIQQTICKLAAAHFGAEVAWLGERNQDGKIFPLASFGQEVKNIVPVTVYDPFVHDYALKPVFVNSSLDLYANFDNGKVFYAIIIPLNWGRIASVLYIYVKELPLLDEQEIQFATSLGNLSELVLSNTRLLIEVKTNQESLQKLSQRLVQVHEEERRYLAIELHDEIGQYLTALKLRLNLTDENPRLTNEQLSDAQDLVNELIQKVRQMSLDLRPSMLDDLGLLPALSWYFDRYIHQTGIEVVFNHNNLEQKRFDNEIEITIFRIIQESLTNVARHAGTQYVTVDLNVTGEILELEIEDEGVGFNIDDQKAGNSSGLTGMAERTKLLRGELEIKSKPGSGTRVLVKLPLKQEEKL